MRELCLGPGLGVYRNVQEHLAIVMGSQVPQRYDREFRHDGKGNNSFGVLADAKIFDFLFVGKEIGAGEKTAGGEIMGTRETACIVRDTVD